MGFQERLFSKVVSISAPLAFSLAMQSQFDPFVLLPSNWERFSCNEHFFRSSSGVLSPRTSLSKAVAAFQVSSFPVHAMFWIQTKSLCCILFSTSVRHSRASSQSAKHQKYLLNRGRILLSEQLHPVSAEVITSDTNDASRGRYVLSKMPPWTVQFTSIQSSRICLTILYYRLSCFQRMKFMSHEICHCQN